MKTNATTDELSSESLDQLAAMANDEGRRNGRNRDMNSRSRQKFDYLIGDAEEDWHNRAKSLAQIPRIKNLKKIGKDARDLTKRISNLLADDEVLSGLDEAARRMPNRNTDGRFIRDYEKDASIFGRLYALRDRLFFWSELCNIAVEEKLLPQPKRERPKNDGSFVVLIYCLAKAWTLGSGQKAGTSSDYNSNLRRGPFVRFVHEAMRSIDPHRPKSGPSGDQIRDALEMIRRYTQQEIITLHARI